jgi:hypothetical protein
MSQLPEFEPGTNRFWLLRLARTTWLKAGDDSLNGALSGRLPAAGLPISGVKLSNRVRSAAWTLPTTIRAMARYPFLIIISTIPS